MTRSLADRLALPSIRGHGGLVAALAVDSVGTGLFMPFGVVYFLYTTDLTLPVVGVSLTIARLLAIPMSLVVGPLIDRYGARAVLVWGNLVGAAAFAGYLLADTVWLVVVVTFLAGAGQSTFWTAIRTLVGTVIPAPQRTSWFALQSMTRNAGFGLGGLIGAVAVGSGSQWVYYLFAGLNAASFVLAAFLVLRWRTPDAAGESARQSGSNPFGGYRQLVRDRALAMVTAVNLAFVMCANVLTILLVVYVTQELHQPPWVGGALFTVNTVLVSTTQTLTTRALRALSHPAVLRLASVLWAGSFALMWLMSVVPEWMVIPGMFIALVTFTVAEMAQDPILNTLLSEISPPGMTGRYMAAFQLSWSFGGAVAPFLLTWLLSLGLATTWLTMIVICLAAVLGTTRLKLPTTEPGQAKSG
ncbi:MFS transporter [Actinokineospora enzanensis]|uniref:MFS transporter n=1 Tax=Actinokineospora enzanensis TaxID=155975 RepID=UPI000365EB79|nr:MFS transporter [Actinokineospora enzanensis]